MVDSDRPVDRAELIVCRARRRRVRQSEEFLAATFQMCTDMHISNVNKVYIRREKQKQRSLPAIGLDEKQNKPFAFRPGHRSAWKESV
jgi:hypothetical protein